MPAIDNAVLKRFIEAGKNADTTVEQGHALEDMISYIFGLVPSVTITHRNEDNVFENEEIDIALWNEGDDPAFRTLPNIILIECKNWSRPVSSIEVNWFDTKLQHRGMDFGILIAPHGITGDARQLTAAHAIIAAALVERRRFLVLTTDELLALSDTDALALLIKTKICDLVVRGALG